MTAITDALKAIGKLLKLNGQGLEGREALDKACLDYKNNPTQEAADNVLKIAKDTIKSELKTPGGKAIEKGSEKVYLDDTDFDKIARVGRMSAALSAE